MADELDGNWEAVPAEATELRVKKVIKGKKRKRTASAADSAAEAPPAAAEAERKESTASKKRRKKAKKKQGLAEGADIPGPNADASELAAWACARLAASWIAEVRAASLSPLEAKEFQPTATWFMPLAPKEKLRRLPMKLPAGCDSKVAPKSVSTLILCASAEQAFAAVGELGKASSKPLVLATHGGGRKCDQVKRQAAALAKGAALAVATPGRLQRLLEEGHLDPLSLKVLVIDLSRDRKQRDVLSLPETRRDLLGLIRRHFMQPLECGRLRVALCGAP